MNQKAPDAGAFSCGKAEPVPYEVYILECGDGTLYTGISTDPDRRARVHNRGKGAKYTRSRLPVVLRYRERLPDKGAALRREYAIKQLPRDKKLALIAAYEATGKEPPR